MLRYLAVERSALRRRERHLLFELDLAHYFGDTDRVMSLTTDVSHVRIQLVILDKKRENYSALYDRIAELQKMTTRLEQIGVSLPKALRVCNEVFKVELAKKTAELAKFPITIGPIPRDPDWRPPMLLFYHLLACGFIAFIIAIVAAGCIAVFMSAEIVYFMLFQPYPEPNPLAVPVPPVPPVPPVVPDDPGRPATTERYSVLQLVAHLNYGAMVALYNMLV
jgi:hypothetical protein